MPIVRKVLPQDAATGRTGCTINGIAELARFTAVARWDAAVAYATRAGCERLHDKLTETTATWTATRKRWLVSMDFGRTEPRALRFLAGLAGIRGSRAGRAPRRDRDRLRASLRVPSESLYLPRPMRPVPSDSS